MGFSFLLLAFFNQHYLKVKIIFSRDFDLSWYNVKTEIYERNIFSGTMQFNITIKDCNTQFYTNMNFCPNNLIYLGDNPFCAVTDLHKEGLTNTTYFLPSLGNFKLEITHKYMAKQDKIDIHKMRRTKLNNHKILFLFFFIFGFFGSFI